MIIHLLLLAWSLAAHISAATLPPTLDLISNLRDPNKPLADSRVQANTSAVEGVIRWYCTKVDSWILPRMKPHDCGGVLEYFYLETMDQGGTKWNEFLAPGAKKTTHDQVEWTPRKYTFGSAYSLPTFLPTKMTLSCTYL